MSASVDCSPTASFRAGRRLAARSVHNPHLASADDGRLSREAECKRELANDAVREEGALATFEFDLRVTIDIACRNRPRPDDVLSDQVERGLLAALNSHQVS